MSDVMLIGILRMPLNLVFPSEPDSVMALQIHARMGEAADRIEADEKEIARLLAVEVAAKESEEEVLQELREIKSSIFPVLPEWPESQYTKTPKFNYDRLARLIEKLEKRVINPIGDTK